MDDWGCSSCVRGSSAASAARRTAAVCRQWLDRWPAVGALGRPAQLRRLAAQAGVRRRFAPHQLRHAHAVEMARDGVSLNVIQRQLGHANLGITSVYLEGIDNAEIIDAVHARRPPMLPATAGPAL